MTNKLVLTKLEAAQEYYKLLSNNFAFKNYQNLDPKIQNLRKRLCSFFKDLQSGRYPYYKVDLLFGLELLVILLLAA